MASPHQGTLQLPQRALQLEEIMIERECLNLMTGYCTHLDRRESDAFLDLFTEDLVWARAHPPGLEYQGRDAMREYFAERPAVRLNYHLTLNPRVTVLGPDAAEGACMLLVVDGPASDGTVPVPMGGISLLGEYRDTYRRTPSGWKIARRELSRLVDRKVGIERF
jgi:ketosteroid isomerase-like protein